LRTSEKEILKKAMQILAEKVKQLIPQVQWTFLQINSIAFVCVVLILEIQQIIKKGLICRISNILSTFELVYPIWVTLWGQPPRGLKPQVQPLGHSGIN
jgi:hypothetical protein